MAEGSGVVETVGAADGSAVGVAVGTADGSVIGTVEGMMVGSIVGTVVVGTAVGALSNARLTFVNALRKIRIESANRKLR